MAERDPDAPTLKRQGLYPCEGEIAHRLSQSEKHWRRIAAQLKRQGLPKIDPIMKGQETAAETRQGIAGLMSRHDTASNGRFQRRNRAVLDQMRAGDRDAWNTMQLRLGDRDANCASAARDRRKQ